MNAAKKNSGAHLEHTLANINVIVPSIWQNLRDTEKWQIGHTYAEAYSDGKTVAFSGLKSALLKVKGFDYVPETLRSDTFIKAAEAVLKAHEGLNNFYNEPSAIKNLSKLGSTIPTPAFPACATALFCVVLGNPYGVAWAAQEDAKKMIDRFSKDRWQYYLNHAFPSDTRIMNKIIQDAPGRKWVEMVQEHKLHELSLKNKNVASGEGDAGRIKKAQQKLLSEYYGK